MTKMEEDNVVPNIPPFYKRFVDDSINKRQKDQSDKLLERMNSYHKNMSCEHGLLITCVHRRAIKLPVHWNSKIPKKTQTKCCECGFEQSTNDFFQL